MSARIQSLANHARYVPLFHFALGALVLLNFFHAVRGVFAGFTQPAAWGLAQALALTGVYWYSRAFPLGVQDRLIRLELRLRCRELLAPEAFRRFDELKLEQMVALRFAGDAELPALFEEALRGLAPGEIKKRVKDWKPDWVRI